MTGAPLSPLNASLESGKLPGATYLLSLCQAINLTAAVVSVTIAALVGGKLAPSQAWATVPYGVQFAAVAIATYPAASFMRRRGRKPGFLIGALCLMAAGCIGYDAIARASFTQLIVAHALLGVYVAFANFYRFAAVDGLAPDLRAKGLSFVVGGGVVAAITGPLMSMGLKDVAGFAAFSLCYASFVLLGLATIGLMGLWKPAGVSTATASGFSSLKAAASSGVDGVATRQAPVTVAVIASALSYLIMNMLMVQASLLMESMCVSFDSSSMAIQGHVVAMFAPSFVTGAILVRAGHRNTLMAGYVLLAASAALGAWGTGFETVVVGLILLGVGWNFGYVGGGALLASTLTDADRHRLQGINDCIIAICATIGAFAPAILQAAIGWRNTNLACLALCVVAAGMTWAGLRENRKPVREALGS
ncbi:MFS transporter [Paraburkholderia sp. BCC1886]|uniref:MFS transporter n=1 Tax=Paraburkholderia sp. BCC1886 TaxID=2562670 RepID=UPI0021B163EA|nr:MFS transporter [Paraburkholderia sp. BCC1886]